MRNAGEVRVWRARLDAREVLTTSRLGWLSDAEIRRAQAFRTAELASRWQIAQLALRDLLAAATGQRPHEVEFIRDAAGKPSLARTGDPQFNLSHSGNVALIAIGDRQPLGVDVEWIQPVPEMEGVAESHFAAEERAALWATPESERLNAFYRCWTRKEAFVKATGSGIGPALSRFAVSIDANRAQLIRADDDPEAASTWTLLDLGLELPYVGALAVRGAGVTFSLRDWTPRHD